LKSIKNVSIIYSTSRSTEKILADIESLILKANKNLLFVASIKEIHKKKSISTISKSDLILVIGGDGTMIGSIRELYKLNIPFLGINLGRVGFLTDIYPKNLSSLEEVLKGKYAHEKRPIYEAIFSEKNKDIFINEVVVHSGSITRMIDLELMSNFDKIYDLKADGIIISSSTGSTAYSFSGGGPIIFPGVSALSLLPMFSHSSSSHSLVMPDTGDLKVLIKNKLKSDPSVVVDGKKKLSYSKAGLTIRSTKKYFHLYHPKDYNYFAACRSKLGWAIPIESLKNE
tara:strand:+ start:1156 stop:2010 length:855 start_codon:yes stop_codon:yes gene_type:complete